VPNKHKEPAKFVYSSGFFITANEYPDFGSGVDGLAIQERLAVFRTRKMPVKDGNITGTHSFSQSFLRTSSVAG